MRGSVVKKGARWYVVVEDRDADTGRRKRRWHSGYRTKRDAQAACSELLASLHRGEYVAPNRQTVEEFSVEWLDAIRATIRPSTMDKYRRDLGSHVLPYVGHVLLVRLDATKLNRLWATLAETGRKPRSTDGEPSGLSSKSIENVAMTLHRMLKDAVRWGRLARNPADAADPPRRSVQARQVQAWDAETLRRFLGECRAADDPLYPLWVFLATTGLRRGEALGLHWVDVELAAARVRITQTLGSIRWNLVAGQPKTSAGRRPIALDPQGERPSRSSTTRARAAASRRCRFRRSGLRLLRTGRPPTPPGACLPSLQAASPQVPDALPFASRPSAHLGDDRPRQRRPPESGPGTPRPRTHFDHPADLLARPADDARRRRCPRRQPRSPRGMSAARAVRVPRAAHDRAGG
jgi:integrase